MRAEMVGNKEQAERHADELRRLAEVLALSLEEAQGRPYFPAMAEAMIRLRRAEGETRQYVRDSRGQRGRKKVEKSEKSC